MQRAILAAVVLALLAISAAAQSPYAADSRVYTLNVSPQPYWSFGSGGAYPRQSYLPPYSDPGADYTSAYQNYRSPYGYRAGGYGGVYPGQSSAATYNSPVAMLGGPAYSGQTLMYLNPFNGSYYAPSMTYQNRRYASRIK
jgi:hypothetical protein